jgi:phosphoglycerol transferase MdoB-like AlkP superfamily enzyme
MKTVIRGHSRDSRFFNSIHYTEKALGEFIAEAKLQSWWDSTLVLVVADHGNVYADVTNYDSRRFHIPLLLLGGALNVSDTVISKYGGQTDIAATLLTQMGLSTSDYKFSRNLLAADSLSYTYYNYHEGIGYVDDSCRIIYDLTSKHFINEKGPCNDIKRNRVKAILQNVWYDFANR